MAARTSSTDSRVIDLLRELCPAEEGLRGYRLVVVSPYLDPLLFERMTKEVARFDDFRIVTDPGGGACRWHFGGEKPLRLVEHCAARLGASAPAEHILVGRSGPLLHAKLYYLHFRASRTRNVRYLVWGSANATTHGFTENGEVLSRIQLDGRSHRSVIDYFESFFARSSGRVPSIQCNVSGGRRPVSLSLPPIQFKPLLQAERLTSFDAWLATGKLIQPWAPPNNFLTFELQLRRAFPQNEQEELASRFGFGRASDTESRKLLRYNYLASHDQRPRGESVSRWKAKLCAQTPLGYWCSAACFRERESAFVVGDRSLRSEHLLFLESLPATVQSLLKEPSVDRYIEAVGALAQAVPDQNEWFGNISLKQLRQREAERAAKRLEVDRRRARNKYFATHYRARLLEFSMPSFLSDQESWTEFRESWLEEVVLESTKIKVMIKKDKSGRPVHTQQKPSSQSLIWNGLQQAISNLGAARLLEDLADSDRDLIPRLSRILTSADPGMLKPLFDYHHAFD